MTLPNGAIVGDYEVIGVLGQGGMGAVYKVRNTISDRVEAMKVLLPNLAAEQGLADRFLREIKLLAKLEHPHITGLRTAFRANDQLWMVMELVDGETLEKLLQQRRPTIEEATGYTLQALDALAYAHEMGIVHRDLKPANIILTSKGTVKLTDFGIAREDGDVRLTRTGTALGSLAYMSPEQIQRGNVDARSDLYSLGVTFYELLTGTLPFTATSEFAIMSAHVMTPPRSPMELNPSIPPHLSAVIMRSLAKDPAQRFQNACEFRDAIQANVTATRISGSTHALPPVPKRTFPKWPIAAGLVAAAGAAFVFIPRNPAVAPPPSVAVQPTAAPTPVPTPAPTAAPKTAAAKPTPTPDPAASQWAALQPSTDVDALNAFREKYAGTPYARQAFLRIIEVQWENARNSNDPSRLRRFIETHPNSAYTAEAKTELERLEKSGAIEGIKQSLEKFSKACESRDMPKLRAMWPSLAGRRLQMTAAMMKNAKSLTVQAEINGDVQVNGDTATVPIRYQHNATRPNGEKFSVDENVKLTMRKEGAGWIIQNFPFLRAQ
jgi:serine/threonine-protein kinase